MLELDLAGLVWKSLLGQASILVLAPKSLVFMDDYHYSLLDFGSFLS